MHRTWGSFTESSIERAHHTERTAVDDVRIDHGGPHVLMAATPMEPHELARPVHVGLLGPRRVMQPTHGGADRFDEGHEPSFQERRETTQRAEQVVGSASQK